MTDVAKKNVRGSTLLLLGRIVSLALNLGTQIVLVRHLSKSDYGLLAYSFLLAELLLVPVVFGLDAAITKYIPIFQERDEKRKLLGTVALTVGSILGISVLFATLIVIYPNGVASQLDLDRNTWLVVGIILFLSPINSLNAVCESLLAAFSSPRSILVGKQLMGPALKLTLVATAIFLHMDLWVLAIGYVTVGASILGLYCIFLLQVLAEEQLLGKKYLKHMELPEWSFVKFAVFQTGTDVIFVIRAFLPAILLKNSQGLTGIADYYAVMPLARLNDVVCGAFGILFSSSCSRLLARGDVDQINKNYWRTAAWITVLTFPVFTVTFLGAYPVSFALLGARYSPDSAGYLSILACGLFFQAALGPNGQTLWMLDKTKIAVLVEVLATAFAFACFATLVWMYGTIGVVIATSLSTIFYGLLNHAAMIWTCKEIRVNWQHTKLIAACVVAVVGMSLLKMSLASSLLIGLPLAICFWFVLLQMSHDLLDVDKTFPELRRISVARWLFFKADAR